MLLCGPTAVRLLPLDSPRRWPIIALRGPPETCPDELVRAVRRELYGSRSAPHEEVTGWARFHALPLEEYRLGAALTAHQANSFPLDDLGLRVDAGATPVTEAVTHDLR